MLKHFKTGLQVEVTNKCNVKCIYCSNKSLSHYGSMTLRQFKTVLGNSTLGRGDHITFCGFGEPFCNNDIYDMIAYAHARDVDISIQTNGMWRFDEKRASVFDDTFVSFSLDATDNDVLRLSRPGANAGIILDNMRNLVRRRNAHPSGMKVFVRLNYFGFNAGQCRSVVEKTKAIGCDRMWICKGYMGDEEPVVDLAGLEGLRDEYAEYLSLSDDFRPTLGGDDAGGLSDGRYDDYRFFQKSGCVSAVIRWTGEVSACCYDIGSKLILGNLLDDTLVNIASKANASRLAARIADTDARVASGEVLPCDTCALNINTRFDRPWRETSGNRVGEFAFGRDGGMERAGLLLFALRFRDIRALLDGSVGEALARRGENRPYLLVPAQNSEVAFSALGDVLAYPFPLYAYNARTVAWREEVGLPRALDVTMFCYENMDAGTLKAIFSLLRPASLTLHRFVREG